MASASDWLQNSVSASQSIHTSRNASVRTLVPGRSTISLPVTNDRENEFYFLLSTQVFVLIYCIPLYLRSMYFYKINPILLYVLFR